MVIAADIDAIEDIRKADEDVLSFRQGLYRVSISMDSCLRSSFLKSIVLASFLNSTSLWGHS